MTVLSIADRVSSNSRMRASGQELGPSLRALSGSGCVSMNKPEIAAACKERFDLLTLEGRLTL